MLSRINRLSGEKNFVEVKRKGKVFQADSFGLVIFDRIDKKPSRFGFVISNKIAKLATERNRVKREMREGVKETLNVLKEGFNVVFLVKQKLLGKPKSEIKKEIKSSLFKAGLIK